MGGSGSKWGKVVALDRFLYVGEFKHNLDGKKRLTVPSKWRIPGDEGDYYLALPNPEGFVSVYPPGMVARLQEKISQISLGDTQAQATLMYLSSMAHSFGCDKQGRMQLNEALMSHAGLSKETLLVGNFSSFSIWSPERYALFRKNAQAKETINAALTKLGL